MMDPATITAIAHLIISVTKSGMEIADVLSAVEKTGIVPPEEWAKLKKRWDDAEDFWTAA